jgi:hypothetical protein
LPATEVVLMNDVYLILLHATRTPPHLLLSINGKTFTLSVKGAAVDGELPALLTLIRRKNIETLFIRLTLPALFTLEQLKAEIRSCTLAYPRADIGIATCLTPINDFCHLVYDTESKNINLIFDLLPKLEQKNLMKDCYQLNLRPTSIVIEEAKNTSSKEVSNNSFELKRYEVNDVHEAIRKSSLIMA